MNNLITVDLDRTRTLKYTLNALILAESLTGKKLSDMGEDKSGFDLSYLRAMLFAGLVWEDKDLTIETVGDLITMDNLETVAEKLGEAMGGLK